MASNNRPLALNDATTTVNVALRLSDFLIQRHCRVSCREPVCARNSEQASYKF